MKRRLILSIFIISIISQVVSSQSAEDYRRNTFTMLEPVSTSTDKWGSEVLTMRYQLGNEVKSCSVTMNKLEHQDFYTFSWDSAEEDFHYSHRPGIYAWYPQTNELKHVTYVGGEASSWGFSAWVHLTDDHKYILEDFGTTPLPRTLKIWRTDTEELVYDGNYNGFVMTDHKVEVAYNYRCYYAGWGDENSQLSDELLDYGRQYLQENPPDNELIEGEHSSICLSIVCEFDMDTREEQILRGEYTPSM